VPLLSKSTHSGLESTSTVPSNTSGEVWHSTLDFARSAAYSAVAEPLLGLSQISDQVSGGKLMEKAQSGFAAVGIRAPEKATSSLDEHAQMLGSAVGMLVPYLLLHNAVRAGGMKVFAEKSLMPRSALMLSSAGEFAPALAKESALAFTTGFLYDSTLRPSTKSGGSFIEDRISSGVAGGLTMATLTASSLALNRIGASSAIKPQWVKSMLSSPISASVMSAIPAGLMHAETAAVRKGEYIPSASDAGASIYQMAFVGAALGSAHKLGLQYESQLQKSKSTALEPTAKLSMVEQFKSAELSQIENMQQRTERLNLPKDFEQSKDLFFAEIKNSDTNTITDVVIRPYNGDASAVLRMQRAQISDNVNRTVREATGVDMPSLPLVLREKVNLPGSGESTVMIQKNGGKQLGTQLREWATEAYGAENSELPTGSITKLINNNSSVRELTARAAVDNMFKGNVDTVEFSQQTIADAKAGSKVLPQGKFSLIAIDNKNDFTLLDKPSWGFGSQFGLSLEVAKALEGKKLGEISPRLQADVEAMLQVFSSSESRTKLMRDGLTAQEIDAARDRLQILAREGLPKHLGEMNFYADEAQQQITASLNSNYDLEADIIRHYLKERALNQPAHRVGK